MKKIVLVALFALCVASLANAQCETLTYQTESLPGFTVGTPAHFDIEAVGGTAPYTFEIIDGTLPDGLHMNSSGKIRGNPREVADTTIIVRLTDANGCVVNQAFAVRVDP
jgi:hypothetical protein